MIVGKQYNFFIKSYMNRKNYIIRKQTGYLHPEKIQIFNKIKTRHTE